MKKILSFVLIFMLSLTLVGISNDVQAADGDVTIYLHIHQYDGDYTNTGTGIYDGVNWNSYGDVVSSTDDFGGIIEKVYSATEIAAVSDSIEMKPTSDVATAEAGTSLLAPGNGQVFADVTSLKDGSDTELHLYYVEGAKDFYVATPDMGLIFVVYTDPTVAANDEAYDIWKIWTWNNGTGGTNDGIELDIDMEITSGDYTIPMKLGVIEVDDTADQDTGFLITTAEPDWSKQCSTDIIIDNSDIRGSGIHFYFYQAGSCELETDYAAYLADVEHKFEMNSGNRFDEGTYIVNPSTMDITMIMPKTPYNLLKGRFTVKDSAGNMIPITSVDYPVAAYGLYDSAVTIQTETHVVVYVDSDETHADMGLAGSFQGWTPASATMSLGDDINGYAVFEFTTYDTSIEFVVLVDVDADGLDWDDNKISGGDNISIDLSAGGTVEVFVSDADDKGALVTSVPADVDITAYTYTSGVTCAAGENLFTLFLDTELDHTLIGVVGSIQPTDWDPTTAITASGETADGEVVFEVCMTDTNVEYKVLYDDDGTAGFNWGDRELVQSNVVVDFGDGTTDGEIAHFINGGIATLGDYATTLTATSIYRLTIYMNGDLDATKVGLVGSPQGWDPGTAITPSATDAFGHAIFDIELTSKTESFKILYDEDDNGFSWADTALTGSENVNIDLTTNNSLVLLFDVSDMDAIKLTEVGADIEALVTTTLTLNFAAEALMFGEEYTVSYIEVVAEGDIIEEVIMSEVLMFGLSNNFGEASPVEGNGTYAISPTEIQVTFDNHTLLLDNLLLTNQLGNELLIQSYSYTNSIGEYTPVGTCVTGEVQIYIHVDLTDTMVDDLTLLGAVGTINGWDIEHTIPAVGMDANGNYVFEVCVNDILVVQPVLDAAVIALAASQTTYDAAVAAQVIIDADGSSTQQEKDDAQAVVDTAQAALTTDTDAKNTAQGDVDNATGGEFKIKYDPDGDGFGWDGVTDPELTPGNVKFTVADGPHFLVEEGASVLNVSRTHLLVLPNWQPLDITKAYTLEFIDENGFVVFIEVDLDTEAPVIDFSIIPNIEFVIDNTDTFDLLDFYTKIQFLDNREGEMEYEFVTNIDLDTVGEQTITIKAVDMWMNETTFDIVITVVDTTAPVITVDSAKTYEFGDEEPDWSSFASTNEGTITIDDSQVDMNAEGIFFVNYTAEDIFGNSTTVGLEVTIGANPVETTTGCGSAITIGSSLIALVALGGTILFFVRKP